MCAACECPYACHIVEIDFESTTMKRSANLFKFPMCTSIALGLLSSSAAHAHEGHGMPGLAHWHSTDVWGFVALAGIVAVVIWMKGRK